MSSVIFRDKSHFNRLAAELCLENNYYAPSVHCSYYSVVQLSLHILFEKQGMTEQTFLGHLKSLRIGTHACAIKLIGLDLIKKQPKAYKDFQRLVPELKELREKSDYHKVLINQDEGYMAMQKSDSIKNILTRNFS